MEIRCLQMKDSTCLGAVPRPLPLTDAPLTASSTNFFKPITHGANVAFAFCEIFEGELGRFSETNNRRDIFRPAAATIFLAAASDQRTGSGFAG